MTDAPIHRNARDFDFLFGSWRITNERLTSRLTDSNTWETFEAEATCRPILGGLGNIDDFRPHRADARGFEGGSLRLFNPAKAEWSIYWMDNVRCALFPPVVGQFVDGVGEFYGEEIHESIPVRVRFRWSAITAGAARWEQAFSTDCGKTWETNWIMTFTRVRGNTTD
jgi:hypothetical protein